jgi:hypothetical protein
VSIEIKENMSTATKINSQKGEEKISVEVRARRSIWLQFFLLYSDE